MRPQTAGSDILAVRVEFGAHCFTRELRDEDPAEFRFLDGRQYRCFCPDRHEMSRDLPALIKASSNGYAYHSTTKNYLLVEGRDGGPYLTCFDLRKARSSQYDVLMFVVSAYQKPNLPRRLPATPFVALAGRVAAGKRIQTGPARAWKQGG